MPLPKYDGNITLEEAVKQFDYVTSQLVLHPLHEEIENPDLRRTHVFEAARDVSLVSSRWIGVLENHFQSKKKPYQESDKELARRYVEDIASCSEVLHRIIHWYSRLEKTENTYLERLRQSSALETEIKIQSERLKNIRKEKSTILSYVSLMGIRNGFAKEFINQDKDLDLDEDKQKP